MSDLPYCFWGRSGEAPAGERQAYDQDLKAILKGLIAPVSPLQDPGQGRECAGPEGGLAYYRVQFCGRQCRHGGVAALMLARVVVNFGVISVLRRF